MDRELYLFEVKRGKKGCYAEITKYYSEEDKKFYPRRRFGLISRRAESKVKEGELLVGRVVREIKDRKGKTVPIVEPVGYPATAFIDLFSKEIVVQVGRESLSFSPAEAEKLGLCRVYRENLFGFLTQIRLFVEKAKKYAESYARGKHLFWYVEFKPVAYEYGEAFPEVVDEFQQIYRKLSDRVAETKRFEELKNRLTVLKMLYAAAETETEFTYDGVYRVKDGEVLFRKYFGKKEVLIPLDVAVLDEEKREEIRRKALVEYEKFLREKEQEKQKYADKIEEIERELSGLKWKGKQYLFLEKAARWIKNPIEYGEELIKELITPSDYETFVDDEEALQEALSVYRPKTKAGLLLLFKVTGKRPEILKGINGYHLLERVELFTELEERLESLLHCAEPEPDSSGPEL